MKDLKPNTTHYHLKPKKKRANLSLCSDLTMVSQDEINTKRAEAYRVAYGDKGRQACRGCHEELAQGSAHSIPQARCKQIHKTELIWDVDNFWPACNKCNAIAENPKGNGWKKLKNKQQILRFIARHDHELYMKFMVNL